MTSPSHYDTLGVAPTADARSLRAAYLAKARAHHPDRHVDSSPLTRERAALTMREVNAAWSVLSDPEARRRYDATIAEPRTGVTEQPRPAAGSASPAARRTAAPAATASSHGDTEDLVGRGLRLVPAAALLFLLLGIVIFTAFVAAGGDDAPTTTVAPRTLAAGMCVRVDRVLTVVDCRDRHDAIVASIVGISRGCSADTGVYTLDAQRVACLRPTP